MKDSKRRSAFRRGTRRAGRSGGSLGIRESIRAVTSAVRCVVWCLLNAFLMLWDLNPVSLTIRRWRKSQPKQASIALAVRPRFRDLIGDWFLSYEGRKRKLLQWVHSVLPWLSDDVMDFGSSWQDGIVLCALMDTLGPGSCLQVHLLKPHHRVNNCRLGIQMAMAYLQIDQATLSPEEMSLAEKGTEVKLVLLVQLVRWHFLKQGSKAKVESHVGSEDPPVVAFKCEAIGTGIKAGIVGKRTKFNLFVESVKHLHLNIEIKGPNNEYNKETIVSMHPRGPCKYAHQNVSLANSDDETKAKVVEDGEGHSFLRQKSLDEGPSHLVIPFDYQCVGEGRFLATYIPRNAGIHYISILSHGNHITGSPFEVKVTDWVSSWNLVPKGRVVPFDMINNCVDGTVNEGTKSLDKVRCKLSSVASVSKKLTTMRRRILKKVITQGGREIIVKQPGDVTTRETTLKQDGENANCPHRMGAENATHHSATDHDQARQHFGEGNDKVGLQTQHHPSCVTSSNTKSCCSAPYHTSCTTTDFKTSSALSSTYTSQSEKHGDNLMDDFRHVKMDVSDKWKMAALKVSINEMGGNYDTGTTSDLLCSTNPKPDGQERDGISCSASHNVSITISHCESKDVGGNSGTYSNLTTSKPSSDETGNVDAFIGVDGKQQRLPSQTKPLQSKRSPLFGEIRDVNSDNSWTLSTISEENFELLNNDKTEPISSIELNTNDEDSTLRQSKELSKTKEEELPLQRCFLRDNYLNCLHDFNDAEAIITSQLCTTCNKTLPSECTCCIDSGNESNTYCEETDGEECSLYSFDVDNVTESSIDSTMGSFQNYFHDQNQPSRSDNNQSVRQRMKRFGNKRTINDVKSDRHQRSFVSFRKERVGPGHEQTADLASDADFNSPENKYWKTLRKSKSLSNDSFSNRVNRFPDSWRQSQSFDFYDNIVDDTRLVFERDSTLCDDKDVKRESQQLDMCVHSEDFTSKSNAVSDEAHKVSIVNNSKMVKSIFYVRKKSDEHPFRSYSLPEPPLLNEKEEDDDDSDTWYCDSGGNPQRSEMTNKRYRFAHVKKVWKSFDDNILEILNKKREHLQNNEELLPVEKKCAEISLKLVENHGQLSIDNANCDKENEEILEVLIENTVITDGFAEENEDDESVMPTTPTSTRIESGLSSMKTSPVDVSSCGDCTRCQDCIKIMNETRNIFGISPLSIEMNKSDNSDWSDDITPEAPSLQTQQRSYTRRDWSPQISDLPKFHATTSPVKRNPELSNSYRPSYGHHTSQNIEISPNYGHISNNFQQIYDNGFKPVTNTNSSRKSSWVEDSDVPTEDSSISGSVSGEDIYEVVLEKDIDKIVPTTSKIKLQSSNSSVTTSRPSSSYKSPSSLPTPKTPKEFEDGKERTTVRNSDVLPVSVNKCLECINLNHRVDYRKRTFGKDEDLNRKPLRNFNKHACNCSYPKLYADSQEIFQNRCALCCLKCQYGVGSMTSHNGKESRSSFVERLLTPTKYKELAVVENNKGTKQHSFYTRDFYWDHSTADEKPFVEKTLTPTKYRKKKATDVSYTGTNNNWEKNGGRGEKYKNKVTITINEAPKPNHLTTNSSLLECNDSSRRHSSNVNDEATHATTVTNNDSILENACFESLLDFENIIDGLTIKANVTNNFGSTDFRPHSPSHAFPKQFRDVKQKDQGTLISMLSQEPASVLCDTYSGNFGFVDTLPGHYQVRKRRVPFY